MSEQNNGDTQQQNPNEPNNGGSPNPSSNNQQIPEGWISPTELETLLRKVRKEEKDKLYTKITQLEETNRTLQEGSTGLEQQLRELQEKSKGNESLQKEIETLKAQIAELSKGDKNQMENNQQTQTQTATPNPEMEALKIQLAETQDALKKMNEFVTDLQQQTQTQQVATLRQSIIAQKAPDLPTTVHQMVQGNTPEEIEASINTARQFYQSVYQEASKNAVAVPAANPVGDMKLPNELSVEQIQSMSPEQWAEWRSKIGMR